MGDASASERAYQRLKSDILSGAIAAGPLDLRLLGDRLRMSVTPVREALARLSAERLVRLAPHYGYAIANPSARRLENLYELCGALVDFAIVRRRRNARGRRVAPAPRTSNSYADGITNLIADIARGQSNLETMDHVVALNDRLVIARRFEPRVFPDTADELGALCHLWDRNEFSKLQLAFHHHFARRVERADAIARLYAEEMGDP